MQYFLMPLARFADFSGRSTRREFWLFHLFYVVAIAILAILGLGRMAAAGEGLGIVHWLIILFVLVMFIPALAVSVRRLHDHDKSGWFYLLSFVPYAGTVFWLIMMLVPGTEGENSYGYDPRDENPDLPDLERVFR